MQTNLKAMRKYDAGLILITLVAVVAFVSVLFSLSPNTSATPRFSQLTYLNVDNGNALDFTTITQTPLTDWTPISSPIRHTFSSRAISCDIARFKASTIVRLLILQLLCFGVDRCILVVGAGVLRGMFRKDGRKFLRDQQVACCKKCLSLLKHLVQMILESLSPFLR